MFNQTALASLDSYKLGHASQYPVGTTKVYSNFTPRSIKHLKIPKKYNRGIIWFGMQAFLQKMNYLWKTTFFDLPFEEIEVEYSDLFAPFCGANGFNTQHLLQLHQLGYLPLEIKMLPEGSRVNPGVPVFTITNTHPCAFWLPNYMETWLSNELWVPSTNATIASAYREIFEEYSKITGGSKEFITWQGHDFSLRGIGGIETGAMSGAAHGLSFNGSDNVIAAKLIRDCYRGKETFVFGSVPASEHSTTTANIIHNAEKNKTDLRQAEFAFIKRYITKIYPNGVCSAVSDSFDFWEVVRPGGIASQLKYEILSRGIDPVTGLSKVVFRPDSGDPVRIICGYNIIDLDDINKAQFCWGSENWDNCIRVNGKYYLVNRIEDEWADDYEFTEIPEWVADGALVSLDKTFGHTVNDQGYKTLNSKVGLIYGDSITISRCEEILMRLEKKGYASDNVVLGIGSYTYQYNTRDTLGFAMKATYIEINGKGQEIYKEPKTDDGTKKSARGLLQVEKVGSDYVLHDRVTSEQESKSDMIVAYLDGKIFVNESYAEIRNRVGYILT